MTVEPVNEVGGNQIKEDNEGDEEEFELDAEIGSQYRSLSALTCDKINYDRYSQEYGSQNLERRNIKIA